MRVVIGHEVLEKLITDSTTPLFESATCADRM